MENNTTKKVTLVEINVFEDMVPLVSGYLQAYACADPMLKNNWEFIKYTSNTKIPAKKIVEDLMQYDSDLFAFSCYLWNMELVKEILTPLMERNPNAYFLLGGPQVMHHSQEYLDPEKEKMFLCNGEGEKTFSNVLRQLVHGEPNFSEVRGISYYSNGTLFTTDPEERIKDFAELPSPFLTGVFDGRYRMTVFETNRGCPFRCGFCFWGAATNDRVYKFDEERIYNEIDWISQNNIPFIFIADANWGMLKRDIEFSRHMAKCKEDNGLPIYIYFSAAKNSPKRVAEITAIFTESGLINAQPISMQSLNEHTLEVIQRKNIRLSAFESLQKDLNERKINSFIELIWPLPGETLQSFKEGIQKLFEREAAVIVCYTHTLLHNTPIYNNQEEYGLEIKTVKDGASEAHLVVGTKDASYEDFKDGMWFYYLVLALHNTRRVHRLTNYLHHHEITSYSDFYSDFIDFCKQNKWHPYSRFCSESVENATYYDITNYPMTYHLTLHENRNEFDELLHEFVTLKKWWQDEKARVLFEIDMLSKPFIYSNTELDVSGNMFQELKILDMTESEYFVEVPKKYISLLGGGNNLKEINNSAEENYLFRLDHKKGQYPFNPTQNRRDNADYCYGMIMKVNTLIPEWQMVELEDVAV